ncbi:hypothetical protein HDV03_004176 [Kappamyces sp. JEL0829]|nr:hypothetical protein HDV03_004176 [Kappamyces sp. JEL0829]
MDLKPDHLPMEMRAAKVGTRGSIANCGILLDIEMRQGCCSSNLGNLSLTANLTSLMARNVDEKDQRYMPTLANGYSYCHLTSLSNGSLFFMDEIYFLGNGDCLANKVTCSPSGFLSIYPSDGCLGAPRTWDLASASYIDTISSLGEARASWTAISRAEELVLWRTYFPFNLEIPDPAHYSYYVGKSFYVLAVLGTLMIFIMYTYRFYRGRTVFMLAYMLSQLFWLGWIVMDASVVFGQYSSYQLMALLQIIRQCLLGVCTLLSVFITANILLIFTRKYSVRNQLLAMLLLFLLQFGLSGHLYIYAILPRTMAVMNWKRLGSVWVIFFYFFDLSPPIYVFYTVWKAYPKNGRSKRALREIKIYSRFVGVLVLLQVVNAVWYIVMFYFTTYTAALIDDRYVMALGGAYAFSYVYHSMVTCILNHHMRAMLRLGAELQAVARMESSLGSVRPESTAYSVRMADSLKIIPFHYSPSTGDDDSGRDTTTSPSPSEHPLVQDGEGATLSSPPPIFSPAVDRQIRVSFASDSVSVTSESPFRGPSLNLTSVYDWNIATADGGWEELEVLQPPLMPMPSRHSPVPKTKPLGKAKGHNLHRLVIQPKLGDDPSSSRNSPRHARLSSRPESPLLGSPNMARTASARSSLIPYTKLERPQSTYSALFSAHIAQVEEDASPHPSHNSFHSFK